MYTLFLQLVNDGGDDPGLHTVGSQTLPVRKAVDGGAVGCDGVADADRKEIRDGQTGVGTACGDCDLSSVSRDS